MTAPSTLWELNVCFISSTWRLSSPERDWGGGELIWWRDITTWFTIYYQRGFLNRSIKLYHVWKPRMRRCCWSRLCLCSTWFSNVSFWFSFFLLVLTGSTLFMYNQENVRLHWGLAWIRLHDHWCLRIINEIVFCSVLCIERDIYLVSQILDVLFHADLNQTLYPERIGATRGTICTCCDMSLPP